VIVAIERIVQVEGLSLDALKAMAPNDLDELLAFGRPITFQMGTATILAEFNKIDDDLCVNLAHIDGGGEGVLVSLRKLIINYAKERNYLGIVWNVHALTCAHPNPRLQRFLRAQGFQETSNEKHGRVLSLRQSL
jgi:hypothetical protein